MARNRVVVTGLGCISPLGNDTDSTWEGIVAGRSGVGPITLFDPVDLKTQIAAEVKDFDPEEQLGRRLARHTDRFTQFALVATDEALKHAGLEYDEKQSERIGVVMGCGIGGRYVELCADH